ncbi:9346_t:CDS:2 [Acaulospora morrowiae]|uniref:Thioredoxin n=1 Tax=Acaulospora morrowiae TaxID=94023 RepID=A0A9N9A8P8_9GLOM|nr:9346_t:CDS:2 [Acaulospora morrowiae]
MVVKAIAEKDSFELEIKEGVTVVDFYADWCGPCRSFAPILEELSKEYEGRVKFLKVNTDKLQDLSASYSITALPTFLIFKNDQCMEELRVIGAVKENLEKNIKQAIGN